MICTNKQMAAMSEGLYEIIDTKGMLGYAAARNFRNLRNAAREYFDIRDNLMQKYGEQEMDESGKATARFIIKTDTVNGRKFISELAEFDDIEHEVEIMQIDPRDAIDHLTGRQMLALEWMFKGE